RGGGRQILRSQIALQSLRSKVENPMKLFTGLVVLSASLLMTSVVQADDKLPADSKPLSSILETVEANDVLVFDVELDDGVWEVTAHKGGTTTVHFIDPVSGEERQRRNVD